MRRLGLAKSGDEKIRLEQECLSLLEKAESLKNAIASSSTVDSKAREQENDVTPVTVLKLQEPRSTRTLSTREQIILLEGSKVHGSVFPPWRESPDDSEFELTSGEPRFK